MKKILAIILAFTLLLALTGCATQEKTFNIDDDALIFKNAGYETSVITDSNEIYEQLNQTVKGIVQLGAT